MSTSSRDINHSFETTQMSISEKVKAEGGRNRKVALSLSQNQSTSNSSRVSLVSTRASSSENGSQIKAEKETVKKLTPAIIKKQGPKSSVKNNSKQSKQEGKNYLN